MKKVNFILLVIFSLVILQFHNAFNVFIFADDFYHFSISHADGLSQIFKFFVPLANGAFYRPIPTQVFYFLINESGRNLFLARVIVFGAFFVALYLFEKILEILANDKRLAYIATFLYAIHFSHVFQLYWLATFQEIAQFAFLAASTLSFLRRKTFQTIIFFIFALLSKEQAIIFPIFLLGISLFHQKEQKMWAAKTLLTVFAIALPFILIHSTVASEIQKLPEYAIHLSPRLWGSNFFWYFAWSLGLPNYLPDLFPSIFSLPTKAFWDILNDPETKLFFITLVTYLISSLILIAFLAKTETKKLSKYFVFCFAGFFLSIVTVLPIFHKWMVRLTLPLLFVSIFQALCLSIGFKKRGLLGAVSTIVLTFYVLTMVLGTKIHEGSSTYFLETAIVENTQNEIKSNANEIIKSGGIYFDDGAKQPRSGWEGSKKLKISLSNQNFLSYFFPNNNSGLKAIFGFQSKNSLHLFVVPSAKIIP